MGAFLGEKSPSYRRINTVNALKFGGAGEAKSMVNALKFQTLYSILFFIRILFTIHLLHKTLHGIANSADPDQFDLGLLCFSL